MATIALESHKDFKCKCGTEVKIGEPSYLCKSSETQICKACGEPPRVLDTIDLFMISTTTTTTTTGAISSELENLLCDEDFLFEEEEDDEK